MKKKLENVFKDNSDKDFICFIVEAKNCFFVNIGKPGDSQFMAIECQTLDRAKKRAQEILNDYRIAKSGLML